GTTSPFAQTTQQGSVQANPFGQPTQATNPFGKPSGPTESNPFSQPSIGQPAALNPFAQNQRQPDGNGFASDSMDMTTTKDFNQQTRATGPTQPGGAFNTITATTSAQPAGAANGPYPPGSMKQHPPVESYAAQGIGGRL